MRAVIRFDIAELRGNRPDVLQRLGMSAEDAVGDRLEGLLRQAERVLEHLAEPSALFAEVSAGEFATIYEGAGANAPASPLEEIYPRADALALFAATLGGAVDRAIRDLFLRRDPALGYVLDATASSAADRLAPLTAQRFLTWLSANGRSSPDMRALAYGPGYCGWHVSGQRALFDRLQPEQIGIDLTASCLMDPMKSVSGVVVAGRGDVHTFRPTYPFCHACTTHGCRARMAAVMGPRN